MSFYQIRAYIEADEYDDNERLVMLMNCTAIAYGGTAKQRKDMANAILGVEALEFDVDAFESIMATQFLAAPSDTPENDAIKEWAADQFSADDPAFKIKVK